MLQQYVSALPAAAALFQPLPAELPQLLPALLENTNRILAAATQVCGGEDTLWCSKASALRLELYPQFNNTYSGVLP